MDSEVYKVIELNCEKKDFTETGASFQVNHFGYSCYLPGTPAALVCSDKRKVWAVSCNNGFTLWKVEGEIAGKRFCPYGVLTHSQQVLIADYENPRILALDTAGSILQCIPLPEEVGRPRHLGWSQGQLVALSFHPGKGQWRLSRFARKTLNGRATLTQISALVIFLITVFTALLAYVYHRFTIR